MYKERRLTPETLWMILAISAVIIVTLIWICQPAEPAEGDYTYLSRVATGAAWDLQDFEVHSIGFVSAVTWRDVFNLDLGLVDFEVVETAGENWWQNLYPAFGISADVIKTIEMFPGLKPAVEWIPGWVGVGAGLYMELEGAHDVSVMVYGVVKW